MNTPVTDTKAKRRPWPLAGKIALAMVLGIVAGLILGENAEPLAKVGSLIIEMIKGLACPLLLFAVMDAFLRTRIQAKSAGTMVTISLINAALAIVIGLGLSNAIKPGRSLELAERQAGPVDATALKKAATDLERSSKGVPTTRSIQFVDDLLAIVPTALFKPVVENSVISTVIVAIIVGAALRKVKNLQEERGETAYLAVENLVGTAFAAIEVVLSWAIQLVPLAVFAVVARTVGRYGFAPFQGLVVYLGVGVLGLAIQVAVVYQAWVKFGARMPLAKFWTGAREAVVYAMGTASSLATLPVTLRSLARIGVSDQSARMAACVGTNLNNDGILLYEAMAVLFVAQACGIDLSLTQQLVAAAACALAGIGISGVPEAGLISLILVVRTVLPDEPKTELIVPMLLTVDWVLGRCRAMTNVTSDILVAILLDRFAPPTGEAAVAGDGGVDMAAVDLDSLEQTEIGWKGEATEISK